MVLNSEKVFCSQLILMANLLYIHVNLPSLLYVLCVVCKGKIVVDHVGLCTTFQPEKLWQNSDELPGTGGHPHLYSFIFLQSVITTWLMWQQPHKTLRTVTTTTTGTKYCYNFHESLSKQLLFYIFLSMHCYSVSMVLTYKCTMYPSGVRYIKTVKLLVQLF
jgi:hypothetical protein